MSNSDETHDVSNDEETGRHVIFFHRDALPEVARMADRVAGISMAATAEEASFAIESEEWRDSETLVLPMLGIAISSSPPEQINRLEFGVSSPIRRIRKEYVFQISSPSLESGVNVSEDYLLGYRSGVNALIADLLNRAPERTEAEIQAETAFRDNTSFTWGLQATGVDLSSLTGNGVRVAMLDTGFDFEHPDFQSRGITSKSFIAGVATANDDNGHGTHCLGTLGGPKVPAAGRRYGVACNAQLFVGKVMKANGKGDERDILHGIEWALGNNCRIVSMSFGKHVEQGEEPDKDYEQIGAIALSRNCVLIAAAGNGSSRPGSIAPVEIPANSKTVMAIGAIDRRLGLYINSNGGINPGGGGIDLVGPGVEVYSSKRRPPHPHYGTNDGTSMATPHVAGIAALLMEADPAATAEQIWTRLTQSAKRLPLSSTDVGSGLVQVI